MHFIKLLVLFIAFMFLTAYPQEDKKKVEEIFNTQASQGEGYFRLTSS